MSTVAEDAAPTVPPTLRDAAPVWARIALLSFGGPAAQIALMHRVIVDEEKWLEEDRFLHALNFCTLLPGPEAQQLATYIGWLMHGVRGGLVAGLVFILPGIIAIMALSWIYVLFGGVGPVSAALFGLKAAVLAIVAEALLRIGRRALRQRWQVALAVLAFLLLFFAGVPFPTVVLGVALIGWWMTPASSVGTEIKHVGVARSLSLAAPWLVIWLVPAGLIVALAPPPYPDIASFFSWAALVTFGGAYAVLAYVGQQAVEHYAWLQPGEMLNGLGLAETTPGPLIMVLQFVGFLAAYRHPGALDPLLAGTLGGLLATFVTFAPCFLWIFAGAPHIERLRGSARLSGALSGITAAVVGVIASLALWFAIHNLFGTQVRFLAAELPVLASLNLSAAALAIAAALALFRFRLGVGWTVLLCAAGGVALYVAGAVSGLPSPGMGVSVSSASRT